MKFRFGRAWHAILDSFSREKKSLTKKAIEFKGQDTISQNNHLL